MDNGSRDPWYHVTAIKGFRGSKNRDKQRNIQYHFYKGLPFGNKGNYITFKKAIQKTILHCENNSLSGKSFCSLLLERFNPGIKTI
jgi:hypothetical protein